MKLPWGELLISSNLHHDLCSRVALGSKPIGDVLCESHERRAMIYVREMTRDRGNTLAPGITIQKRRIVIAGDHPLSAFGLSNTCLE